MNPSTDSDALAGVIILLLLVSLVAAIPGTILGLKDRLVIYNGKTDLILAYIIPLCGAVWIPDCGITGVLFGLLLALGILLVSWSVGKTWTANRSLWKTTLVLPTKFILAWGIVICALLAVGGLISGTKELKERQYGKAAKQFAIGAVAGMLFSKMKGVIQRLIKSPTR